MLCCLLQCKACSPQSQDVANISRIACRLTISGVPVLESGKLNLRRPAAADLAKSLPISWEGQCCDYKDESGTSHPLYSWLQRLWSLVGSVWYSLPRQLEHYLLVPISEGRLASPAHCRSALSTSHLSSMPADAADLLTAAQCLCITAPYANTASQIPTHQPPVQSIITALSAAAAQSQIPVATLISEAHLGPKGFEGLCHLLAALSTQQAHSQVWSVLRQCCIFTDLHGVLIELGSQRNIRLLPNAAWEQRLAGASDLVLWTPLCYHTASDAQRKLLQMAGLPMPSLVDFLEQSLLPDIQRSVDARAQSLVFDALDELALHRHHLPAQPRFLCIRGQCTAVRRLVDSSVPLLKTLFEFGSSGAKSSKRGLGAYCC